MKSGGKIFLSPQCPAHKPHKVSRRTMPILPSLHREQCIPPPWSYNEKDDMYSLYEISNYYHSAMCIFDHHAIRLRTWSRWPGLGSYTSPAESSLGPCIGDILQSYMLAKQTNNYQPCDHEQRLVNISYYVEEWLLFYTNVIERWGLQ
jgi:hypothetical protein